ncbi:MAG: carboxypeptidase-like regulatory domain-containing protein [Planctomycetaceae bacterium]
MLFRICFLGTAVILVVAGCTQRISPPATVPVSGRVTFKGRPAPGIRVTLHPQFRMGRVTWGVVGETGPTGEFTIGTGAPGSGAPPGEYIVTFTKPRIAEDLERNGTEMEVDDFRGKYSNPEESNWSVSIVNGENRLEPFELD